MGSACWWSRTREKKKSGRAESAWCRIGLLHSSKSKMLKEMIISMTQSRAVAILPDVICGQIGFALRPRFGLKAVVA
jgi:hypothetical protein